MVPTTIVNAVLNTLTRPCGNRRVDSGSVQSFDVLFPTLTASIFYCSSSPSHICFVVSTLLFLERAFICLLSKTQHFRYYCETLNCSFSSIGLNTDLSSPNHSHSWLIAQNTVRENWLRETQTRCFDSHCGQHVIPTEMAIAGSSFAHTSAPFWLYLT